MLGSFVTNLYKIFEFLRSSYLRSLNYIAIESHDNRAFYWSVINFLIFKNITIMSSLKKYKYIIILLSLLSGEVMILSKISQLIFFIILAKGCSGLFFLFVPHLKLGFIQYDSFHLPVLSQAMKNINLQEFHRFFYQQSLPCLPSYQHS